MNFGKIESCTAAVTATRNNSHTSLATQLHLGVQFEIQKSPGFGKQDL